MTPLDRIMRALAALPAHKKQALRARVEAAAIPTPKPQRRPSKAPSASNSDDKKRPIGYLFRGMDGHLHVGPTKQATSTWDEFAEAAQERLARSLA